jgi:class 3 adenylate cyclase
LKFVASAVRTLVTFPIRTIQRLVDLALILSIICFLILFGLQFPHSARLDEVSWVVKLRQAGTPVIAHPAAWVGLDWPASTTMSFSIFLPLLFAFGVWLFKIAVDATFLAGLRYATRATRKGEGVAGAEGAGVAAFRTGALFPARADTEEARDELLRRYREIEAALKSAKRKRCTFLSVDVVGSTTMKIGERDTEIAATFQAYEEMLREIFDQYGAWKQAWTPDGVMICFLQTDLAVGAAQRILEGLKTFNERDNKLRTEFKVRAGMNEGEVSIYEDSKLEKVTDRVIDVAGHMQKLGPVGQLWVSGAVYESITDKAGFIPTSHEVDGFKVFQWTPSTMVAASAAVPEKEEK